MNVAEQARVYLEQLRTRKRSPVRGNTLSAYQSYLKNWIEPNLGLLDLSQMKNGVMRQFVSKLSSAGLAPASVAGIVQFTKGIVKSAVNDEGDYLYPPAWNNDFIDAEPIDQRKQESPLITAPEVTRAISAVSGQYRPLLAALGGCGARISEIIALKKGASHATTYWDYDESIISIDTQIYKGAEQPPKTEAGHRRVDICSELNEYLNSCFKSKTIGQYLFSTRNGSPLPLPTLYGIAKRCAIPGFHSFRRFRVTWMRSCKVPEDVLTYWIGHAKAGITSRYSKLSENNQLKKEWAEKCGLGFDLSKQI